MKNDALFKDELAKLSLKVSKIISDDEFPCKVSPKFLRDAVKDYPSRRGKGLRPALLTWSCGLLGGNPQLALMPSAAVEIYHNWTLVHDDIIDRDSTRRGLPTCHTIIANFAKDTMSLKPDDAAKFGNDLAMLAGDIQQAWSTSMILRSEKLPAELRIFLAEKLQSNVNRPLISGEALDVESSAIFGKKLPSTREVEKICRLKTAALLSFCAESGAIIATFKNAAKPQYDSKSSEKLAKFADYCGLAFQLKDDWLGIYGDEETLGKPIASDIAEAKPTVLLLKTLELCQQKEKSEILSILGSKAGKREIGLIKKIMTSSGAESYVLRTSQKLASKALAILESFPQNKYRDLLEDWTHYVLDRKK